MKRLNDYPNHRLATTGALLKRQIFRIISDEQLDITPDQWVILAVLWEDGELPIGELANRSLKDFANTTRIVQKLEESGYISKRKNKDDTRSSLIRATEKGKNIREKVEQCWKRSTQIAMEGLSDEELEQLMKTLVKVQENVMRFLG